MSDHNSLRVKRKRRRPTKTEFPSPEHRGDSHEEGTAVKGTVFSRGRAVAVWVVLTVRGRAVVVLKLDGLWSWWLPTANWDPNRAQMGRRTALPRPAGV